MGQEQKRLQKLENAGIKVLPAAVRYSRLDTKGMSVTAIVNGFGCLLTNRFLRESVCHMLQRA